MTPSFRLFLSFTILAVTVAACQPAAEAPEPTQPSSPASTETAALAPTAEELAAATYEGVYEEPVTLVEGNWEGEPFDEGGASRPTVGLVRGFRLTGDLNGDGREEAVALLSTSSGGSGTFDYIAAMGRRDGGVVTLGSAELGDRVKVRSAEIDAGRIVIDTVQAGPDDPACCPGQKMRRTWVLGENGLTEASTEDMGRMSLVDLAGVEWVLTRFGWDKVAPSAPEITLVFAADGISGGSGCNRYMASAIAGEMPGQMSVGQIAGTRMACPDEAMKLEDRYRDALKATTQYSFLAGHLVLSWNRDEDMGTLFFSSRPMSE